MYLKRTIILSRPRGIDLCTTYWGPMSHICTHTHTYARTRLKMRALGRSQGPWVLENPLGPLFYFAWEHNITYKICLGPSKICLGPSKICLGPSKICLLRNHLWSQALNKNVYQDPEKLCFASITLISSFQCLLFPPSEFTPVGDGHSLMTCIYD